MTGDTQEKIQTRTGRNLNKRMPILSASPTLPQVFQLSNNCTVEWCKQPLKWIHGSSVCSCDNGHIHDYKSGEYQVGV